MSGKMRNPTVWVAILSTSVVALQGADLLWFYFYVAPTIDKGLVGFVRFVYLFLIPQMFFSAVTLPFLVWLAMLGGEVGLKRLRARRAKTSV